LDLPLVPLFPVNQRVSPILSCRLNRRNQF
jgi:hypothetical protein